MPFRTMEYISDQAKYFPPYPQNLPISGTQTITLCTLTKCSFVSHTHIYKLCSSLLFAVKKHDSFHTVNRRELLFLTYSPAQRNASFIFHWNLFDQL